MKIMTFNTQHCLNFVTREIDFQVMADAILECRPDIVGLNEMRDESDAAGYDAQVKILAELTGMQYYYFAKATESVGGPYGNGFLSRLPIVHAETVLIDDPNPKMYDGYYETRCILKATLEGGITVLVTHMGLNPDEQHNAVLTLMAHATDTQCIAMGDFNMTPDNPILLPLAQKMTDTAQGFCSRQLSFPSDNPDRKIDYIFVSPDVQVLSAEIPAIVSSDHRPVLAEVLL